MDAILYTDGGARGNPGPAAAGFVLTDRHRHAQLAQAFFIGEATNNIAEYTALLKGLQAARQMNVEKLLIRSDSELMVRQIKGEYKVKNAGLAEIYSQCMELLLAHFSDWKIEHIPREQNSKADALVNRSLDSRKDIEERATTSAAPTNQKAIQLGILLSGGGRTMLNLLTQINAGTLNANIALVISSRMDIAGVEKAKAAGLNLKIVRRKDYPDVESFSDALAEQLKAAKVDLVVQAGWLCLWHIPEAYKNRVMNIHPALLPSFGGQGMWGHHVHEAVLKAGCKVSGCTVHFCTNEYDEGPIILQRCCPVQENDTPDTLAERVFEQECIAYPEAIRLLAAGRLTVEGRVVRIKQ
jgi:phosphoribosylglycinamide formyltransferase 1